MVSLPSHDERTETDPVDRLLEYVGVANIVLAVLLIVVALAALFPLELFGSPLLAPLVFTLVLTLVFVAASRLSRRRSNPVIRQN